MAGKLTQKALQAKVDQFLDLAPLVERYKELESEIKAGMVALDIEEVARPGRGRVKIARSERVVIPVEAARTVLGPEMASKVIQVRESVSSKTLETLVEAKVISVELYKKLDELAERKPIVSLYVRPLS